MTSSRLNHAKEAAKETGKTLLNLYQQGNQTGFLKEDQTLVTDADKAADKLIQDMINSQYPADKILSEEGSTIYPDSKHVWIIDPLDGTVNFSRGLIYWGVSIAHLVDGNPETAVLYFPATDELFTAVRGEGAELNGKPIRISTDFDENLFPIFVHCSRMHQRYKVDLSFKKRSLGAAAYHLCMVANNKAVLAFESSVRIWDFAASWLIIEESGGMVVSHGENHPFPATPGVDYHKIPFPIIGAISENVLTEARMNIVRRES